MSYQLYADVRDKNFNLNETDEQRNFYSLEGARAALGGNGTNRYKKVDKSKYNYFMTLGQLMTYIQHISNKALLISLHNVSKNLNNCTLPSPSFLLNNLAICS